MFWKKSPQPQAKPQNIPKTDEELLQDATSTLAKALNSYSKRAYEAAESKPDPELQAAYNKIRMANEIIKEGRIGYALVQCLLEHIKYWPSSIQREDYEQYVGFKASNITVTKSDVGFKASNITATKSDDQNGQHKVDITSIEFSFDDTRYRLILRDEGYSSHLDDVYKFGKIELQVDNEIVVKLGLVEDLSKEYSNMEYSGVEALKVGHWMQAVLDMAAQIVASDKSKRDKFTNDHARSAASQIKLD